MISPLIKWDHSEDHFVMKYDEKLILHRTFPINISDSEHEFVTGHTIDGLFECFSFVTLSLLI